jgi:hypothetical protein
MTEQVGSTLKSAMESALKDNQTDIVERTVMKQEADQAEKQKRCRNIVITGIPESTKSTVEEKKRTTTSLNRFFP